MLAREEALMLAREGHKEWNVWSRMHERWEVNFEEVDFGASENSDISFEDFVFTGIANFVGAKFHPNAVFNRAEFRRNALFSYAQFDADAMFIDSKFGEDATFAGTKFSGTLWFSGAEVRGDAFFDNAQFGEFAWFRGAQFRQDASFTKVDFAGSATFEGATFEGAVFIQDAAFRFVPDFRHTEFRKHVTLHGVQVTFASEPNPLFFSKTPGDTDADKYRRLKELAVAARDHDREQYFFACELKSKRFHETRGLALVPSYLYEWFSDFGRSLARPTVFIFLIWFICGLIYADFGKQGEISDGLIYSARRLLPVPGSPGDALNALEQRLFAESVPAGVFALTLLEGFLGAVFLFLIGLALRNRFRI